jgi:hypothetical protein
MVVIQQDLPCGLHEPPRAVRRSLTCSTRLERDVGDKRQRQLLTNRLQPPESRHFVKSLACLASTSTPIRGRNSLGGVWSPPDGIHGVQAACSRPIAGSAVRGAQTTQRWAHDYFDLAVRLCPFAAVAGAVASCAGKRGCSPQSRRRTSRMRLRRSPPIRLPISTSRSVRI